MPVRIDKADSEYSPALECYGLCSVAVSKTTGPGRSIKVKHNLEIVVRSSRSYADASAEPRENTVYLPTVNSAVARPKRIPREFGMNGTFYSVGA